MGEQEMGKVLTEATVENLEDLWAKKRGLIPPDQVRRVVVPDALVDTGAYLLSMPTRLIRQLGLTEHSKKRVLNSHGQVMEANVYGPVRLTIQGRDCPMDVIEVPDNVPMLIGQIPLEAMDFVVDPKGGKLTGNPAHGGEQVLEMLSHWIIH